MILFAFSFSLIGICYGFEILNSNSLVKPRETLAAKMPPEMVLKIPAKQAEILKKIDDWDFDIFALAEIDSSNVLKYTVFAVFNDWALQYQFDRIDGMKPQIIDAWITKIEKEFFTNPLYFEEMNPYHNNIRAADLVQTTHYLVKNTGLKQSLESKELLQLFVASIVRYYKHPGTDSKYEKDHRTNIWKQYSHFEEVLTEYSLNEAWKLFLERSTNIFQGFEQDENVQNGQALQNLLRPAEVRNYFTKYKDLDSLLLSNSEYPNNMQLMIWTLITADQSNLAKPWKTAWKWIQASTKEDYRLQSFDKGEIPVSFADVPPSVELAKPWVTFMNEIVIGTFDLFDALISRKYESGNEFVQHKTPWYICIKENQDKLYDMAGMSYVEKEL